MSYFLQHPLPDLSGKFCSQTGKTPDSTAKEAQREKKRALTLRISTIKTCLSLDIRSGRLIIFFPSSNIKVSKFFKLELVLSGLTQRFLN